jgi:FkbM family methyltransferase
VSILRPVKRSAYWVGAITKHPANRGARLAALRRAATWHLRALRNSSLEALVIVDGTTRLIARPNQFSAVWTIYDGVHEWEELQFCLSFLRAGDHFVDVGANVGVFSTLVGTRLPGVRITAIEPFPPVRLDLERNLAENHLNVTVVSEAVSAEPGEAVFEILGRDVLNRLSPDGDVSGDHTAIRVEVTTLDALVGADPPSLIKIDVEGSELNVLRGASRLLVEHSPVLLFEHCGHGAQFGITPADMQAFLHDAGYRMYLLDGDLTPWDSDELPTTPNVVAARDIELVRQRCNSPGGAPATPPVRVSVDYRVAGARS